MALSEEVGLASANTRNFRQRASATPDPHHAWHTTLYIASEHDDLAAAQQLGLLAERIAHDENGDMKEWKEWHKDNVGEEPKARWTKVQVIQSVLNDLGLP